MVVYDVSLRVPGNPILATTTPYTKYQYGQTFGVGRRIAMEIRRAATEGRLADIVTSASISRSSELRTRMGTPWKAARASASEAR